MSCVSKVLATQAASFPDTTYRVGEGCFDVSAPLIRVFIMDLWCYTPYYDRYLCEGLAGENIEATLGSVSPYQDPEYFRRNGVRNDPGLVDVVPKLRISNDNVRRVLMLVESCINMAALLARFAVARPEILHVQWTPLVRRLPFEIWFLRLAKRLKIKLVYTVHNVLPHDTARRFAPVFRRLYQEMDGLICHTGEAKGRLVREFSVDPEHVWVIPHGPLLHDAKRSTVRESKRRLSLSEDEILVVWQGIVRSYKGLNFLLEAWSRVEADSLKARLLIAGTGEPGLLEEIKEQVVRWSLHKSVSLDLRFIRDEELPTYYQAADIMVYPYREVTTSGALMTALALQKPIVATTLPAFKEVLRDGETALLVNYGDVDGLAAALTRLIQNPKEREHLALHTALSQRSCHSWTKIANETRQCYSAVLYGRGCTATC